MTLTCNIVTFSNSSGLTVTEGSTAIMSPKLDESVTGSATVADPAVYQYSFELTEAEVTQYNLPDLTSDKEITCYMNVDPFELSAVTTTTNILTASTLSGMTLPIQTASGSNNPSSPSTPTGDNTSSAINLIGKEAIITSLTLSSLLMLY